MSKPSDEFSTNVPDKEERKKLRKSRAAKNNVAEVSNNDDANDSEQNNVKTGEHQVSESLYNLDRRKHSGLQDVTSLRVTTNDMESKRRIEDEDLRRSRLAKLQHEALASAKSNAAVEMKWAELLE